MTNVTKLPGAPTPDVDPVTDTVELLEKLLAKAKTGELRSVAVAYTDCTASVMTVWNSNREFYKLLGGVTQLIHEMAK